MIGADPATLRDVKDGEGLLKFVPTRGFAVQAGGNVGVYPAMLARYFEYVVTFEPEEKNYRLLLDNLVGIENITALPFALGKERKMVSLSLSDDCGGHRISEQPGDVVMTALDLIDLPACDLIWLDVEGYEIPALMGAERTIREYGPAIIVERAGLAENPRGFLNKIGYTFIAKVRHDYLYKRLH